MGNNTRTIFKCQTSPFSMGTSIIHRLVALTRAKESGSDPQINKTVRFIPFNRKTTKKWLWLNTQQSIHTHTCRGVKLAWQLSQAAVYFFLVPAVFNTDCGDMCLGRRGHRCLVTLMLSKAVAWGCHTPCAPTSAIRTGRGGSWQLS